MWWSKLDRLLRSSRRPCGWVGHGRSGPALPPTAPRRDLAKDRCALSGISGPLATRLAPRSKGEVTAEFTFPSTVVWISAPGETFMLGLQWLSFWVEQGVSRSKQSKAKVHTEGSVEGQSAREVGPGAGPHEKLWWWCMHRNIYAFKGVCMCVRFIHIYLHGEGGGERGIQPPMYPSYSLRTRGSQGCGSPCVFLLGHTAPLQRKHCFEFLCLSFPGFSV